MFIMILLFFILGLNLAPSFENTVSLDNFISNPLIKILINIVIVFIIIVIHELIHGLFFKVFTPHGKVKFGFKSGMAYATSPGNLYNKIQMSIIALAPFLFISLALTLIMIYFNINIISYSVLAGLHAGACVGDFYYIYLLVKAPQETVIEDTEQGIRLYIKEYSLLKK